MIYLGSPYSSPDPLIMRTRFLLAEQVTAKLLSERLHVYSPIVHCHELAHKYNLPKEFSFWQEYNFNFLRRADQLYVLKIEGWDTSRGLTAEITLAKYMNLPVRFVNDEGESCE